MSQWCFCASLVKIHWFLSTDRVQTRLIFTVFIVWWPWKLVNVTKVKSMLLIIPMIQHIKSGQNPLFGSRDRVQTSFFVTIWHSKCWCDLGNEVNVIKIKWFLSHVTSQSRFYASLVKNPPIDSGDSVQTRLLFIVFIVWWPWKIDQGHQKIFELMFGQNPSFGSRDMVQTITKI